MPRSRPRGLGEAEESAVTRLGQHVNFRRGTSAVGQGRPSLAYGGGPTRGAGGLQERRFLSVAGPVSGPSLPPGPGVSAGLPEPRAWRCWALGGQGQWWRHFLGPELRCGRLEWRRGDG